MEAEAKPEKKTETEPKAGKISSLVGGLLAPLRGAGFMAKNKTLIPLAVIPVILNTILFALFFFLSLKYFNKWLTSILPQSEEWYWVALIYLLMIVLIIVLLLAIVLAFVAVANILASPFNDALSAKTEMIITGRKDEPFSISAVIKEVGRTIVEELKKILFYLVAMGVIFLFNLIPVIGSVIYVVLGSALTVFWLGLSFLDYSFARKQYKFGQKLKFIKAHPATSFGFGLSIFVGVLIPVFNLFFFPIAVVGGTLLYLEIAAVETDTPKPETPAN